MGRLIVISNRVSAPKPRSAEGAQGGLAVALLAALQESKGLWFGWSGEMTDMFSGEIHREVHAGVTTAGEVERLVLTNKDRLLRFGAELVFALCEHFGCEVERDRRLRKRRIRHDADERAFEFTDVRRDDLRDERRHFVRYRNLLALGLLAKDCFTRFDVGCLDIGQQAPLETRS